MHVEQLALMRNLPTVLNDMRAVTVLFHVAVGQECYK